MFERPLAASPPERGGMGAVVTPQLVGHPEEGAVEHRAIVVGQIDKPSFDDKAAAFNQLLRAFTTFYNPVAGVAASHAGFNPMPHGR